MTLPDSPRFTLCDPAQLDSADKIDELRARFQSELWMLHELRNDFAAINRRLPVEILAEIFLHLVHLCSKKYDFDRRFMRHAKPLRPAYRWIRVTHVCRYWRNVALNSPRLWTLIVDKTPEPLGVFLERSRHAPLELMPHHLDKSHADKIPSMVLNNAYRLRLLKLEIPFPFKKGFAPSVGAPLLEELHIRDHSPTSIDSSNWRDLVFPRLRKADLPGQLYTSLRRAISHATMTHLTLRGPQPAAESVDDLIDILGILKSLQELQLHHVLGPRVPETSLFASHQATFPQMRLLTLVEEKGVPQALHFLNHVSIPPSAKIYFDRQAFESSWSSSLGPWSSVLEALAAKIDDDTLGPTKEIISCRLVYEQEACDVIIEVVPTETDIERFVHGEHSETPLFVFRWAVRFDDDAEAIIRFFIDTFSLSHLRILAVCGVKLRAVVRPVHWDMLSNIRELFLDDIASMLTPRNLSVGRRSEESPNPPHLQVPFPSLDYLGLWNVRWRQHPIDHPLSANDECPPRELVTVLRERTNEGFSLGKLFIIMCHNIDGDQDEPQKLEVDGLVENVDVCLWEPKECSTCDEDEDEDEDSEEDDEDEDDIDDDDDDDEDDIEDDDDDDDDE